MTDNRANAIDELLKANYYLAKGKGAEAPSLALAVAICYTIDDLLHDETNIVTEVSLDRKLEQMKKIMGNMSERDESNG